MRIFGSVLGFELRHHLRSGVFWLAAAGFGMLAFGAVTTDAVMVGGAIGNVNRNAPFVIVQMLGIFSVVGVFVTTAFVAGAVLRDRELGTDELFFATPMSRHAYLGGRFLGAFVASVLIFVPVAVAIMLGGFMPWLDPARIGPFSLSPYGAAFLLFVIPNLFLMGALFFGLATLTRSMMWTYVGLVGLFVAYAVAGTLVGEIEYRRLGAFMDPFALGTFFTETRFWTPAERNTLVPGLEGLLLWNRVLWTGVGVAALGATWLVFRPRVAGSGGRRRGWLRWRGRATTSPVAGDLAGGGAGAGGSRPAAGSGVGHGSAPWVGATAHSGALALPRIVPLSGLRADLTRFRSQVAIELRQILRSFPFWIILAFGAFNLVGGAMALELWFGTAVYPVTRIMVDLIWGNFLLFLVILLALYSGELVWRDREGGVADVVDATATPSWVLWSAKMAALVALVLVTLAAAVIATIGVQLAQGYTALEMGLYLRGVVVRMGIPFIQIGVLALLFQVLVNQKYLGFGLMALFFVSIPVLDALDLHHRLYRFSQVPSAPYSDMNGFGHFVAPVAWFSLYWTFAAAALLVLVHLFWVRGRETGFRTRLALARARFTGPTRGTLAFSLAGFAAVGGWIFYNTNVLNEYVSPDELRDRQAHYEREYKEFEGLPQPRIAAVYAEVDIHPERRDVQIRGHYRLENRTEGALDSLHFSLPTEVEVRELGVPGRRVLDDEPVGYRIYELDRPLEPGEAFELPFELEVVTRGFVTTGADNRLAENGTFFSNMDYFPHIGYQRGRELQDPNERRKRELPPVQRMPPLEDEAARANNYISSQADWVEFETVVSTSEDQIAIAPGYLTEEWTENGRRHFRYEMDAPILAFWAYLSGRYEVVRDRWNDEVEIEVYHHPGHEYNVERMIESVKHSLDYFTENFAPYQHRQVRIIEFPAYRTFAQAFPNTIPYSEGLGFIARLTDPDDIDYVYYVTAHEVAHQWWAHQVIGANQQGATFLSETLAQYSALMVMEEEYGPLHMRRFLEHELEQYLQGRGGELIEELPLLRVENQGYIHYNKGSVAMYRLRELFGEDRLNRALAGFIERTAFQDPPYANSPELLEALREEAPANAAAALEDLFETITLWDVRAEEALARQRDDGRWEVRLEVEARKLRADGEGEETEVPMDDLVEIGVFGAPDDDAPPEGRVLHLETIRLQDGSTTFELVVDEEPVRAGVDPFSKLIDRSPDTNLTRVTVAEG